MLYIESSPPEEPWDLVQPGEPFCERAFAAHLEKFIDGHGAYKTLYLHVFSVQFIYISY